MRSELRCRDDPDRARFRRSSSVNRDNTVTVLDLVIVRQNLVGAALSGSFDASRCDFDGDPGCGVDDAFVLDRILKGAPTSLVDACPALGSPLR